MKNTDEPAFNESIGITKREYFVAMAMIGICAAEDPGSHCERREEIARTAIALADEVLKKL